jgi:hypothetical protein
MNPAGSQCDDQIDAVIQQDCSLMLFEEGKEATREGNQVASPEILFPYLNHPDPGFHRLG